MERFKMCNAGTIQSETQQHACIATHSIRVHILSDHPECEVRNDRSTMSRSVDVIAPMDDANERWDPSSPRKGFAFVAGGASLAAQLRRWASLEGCAAT
ncbi:hypothetical protein, partial [Bradyrhizobium sp.]|uniref:hypothetical protein n=1 Tax=Bradyrhizobium sp. TaxID=376 RepID=UPI0025C6799D